MIQITDKSKCCGCNACGDVCTHTAITYQTDIEGFWYPVVDKDKCTDCGLCEKVCPELNIQQLKKNDFEKPECYAAIHKNIEIRFDSTSGGLFSALAQKVYRDGGYVGGAIYNDDYSVRHFISSEKGDLEALRGSKYLQSSAEGFYKAVKDVVKTGVQVLVCGTPCQMAALRAFLCKNYENLIIIDFICRGINSPKVFRKYLDYLENRFQSKIVYYKSKDKELGWRQLTGKAVFANGKVLYDTKDVNLFTIGYLRTNVYSRPSCYTCQYKDFPRMADITIADLWGVEKIVGKEMDNDLGTSLVMVNSKKGKAFYESIQANIISKYIDFETTLRGNLALTRPLDAPLVDRDCFYKELNEKPFIEVAGKYIAPPALTLNFKQKLKNVFRYYYNLKNHCGWNLPLYCKNLYYNFCCPFVKADITQGHYMLINTYTVVELHKGSSIELKGILNIGEKRFKKSRLETRLLVEAGATLKIDNWFNVGYGSDIEVFHGATLHLHGKGGININGTIICGEHIELGEGVMIGRGVTIRDNNGNHFMSIQGYKNTRPVIIGQHVWLCEGCTILAGVKVGDGAVVGAKAVVAQKVPAFSLVSGNPMRVVQEKVYWKY